MCTVEERDEIVEGDASNNCFFMDQQCQQKQQVPRTQNEVFNIKKTNYWNIGLTGLALLIG